jgi:predicted dehydrogenase
VCDPVPGRAQAAAEKYNVGRGYEMLDELLADDAVDAVIICSPIGIHYEQGMAAIRAGKHHPLQQDDDRPPPPRRPN